MIKIVSDTKICFVSDVVSIGIEVLGGVVYTLTCKNGDRHTIAFQFPQDSPFLNTENQNNYEGGGQSSINKALMHDCNPLLGSLEDLVINSNQEGVQRTYEFSSYITNDSGDTNKLMELFNVAMVQWKRNHGISEEVVVDTD